jgi:hypothetical protein
MTLGNKDKKLVAGPSMKYEKAQIPLIGSHTKKLPSQWLVGEVGGEAECGISGQEVAMEVARLVA